METIPVQNPLGRPLKFTPSELVEKFAEYVKWCGDNPFRSGRKTTYKDGYADVEENLARRISISGFLNYLGASQSWWSMLGTGTNGPDFLVVKEYIKSYCETLQVDMAAAGLLKENIISRVLGLADKQNVEANIGASGDLGIRIVDTRKVHRSPLIIDETPEGEATETE